MLRLPHVLLGALAATLVAGAPAYAADTPAVDVSDDVAAITTSSATVSGTVNPDGSAVTDCRFNYGTDTDYGQSAPCSVSPGAGNDPVTVSAALAGLPADTTIHFQLQATNGDGTEKSLDSNFSTGKLPAPVVTTGAATNVQFDRATLTGTVDPNGLETSCHFEYAESTSYAFDVPCTPAPGSGTQPVAVSGIPLGLFPSLLWHYRLVAQNSSGQVAGADLTFTSLAEPPSGTGPGPDEIFRPRTTTVRLPSSVKVKSGKAAIKVGCTGDYSCNGPLTLSAKVKSHGRTKTLSVGRVVVSLSPKTSRTFSIKLSSGARTALERGHSLKVTAKLEGMTKTITFKA
jgi:hypothetical protein